MNVKGDISSSQVALALLIIFTIAVTGVLLYRLDLLGRLDIFLPNFGEENLTSSDNEDNNGNVPVLAFGRDREVRNKFLSFGIRLDKEPCQNIDFPACMNLKDMSDEAVNELINYKEESYGSISIFDYTYPTNTVLINSDAQFADYIFQKAGLTTIGKPGENYQIDNNIFTLQNLELDNNEFIKKAYWSVKLAK